WGPPTLGSRVIPRFGRKHRNAHGLHGPSDTGPLPAPEPTASLNAGYVSALNASRDPLESAAMNAFDPFPLDGGCTCRGVRYRMKTKPLWVNCCHCRWCQRETG